MADFNIMIVEVPDSSPDRARLIKGLTEGEASVPDSQSAEDAFKFIEQVANNNEHHAVWYGAERVYIWPISLGIDPIKAFEGMVV